MALSRATRPAADENGADGELINWAQEWKRQAEARALVLLRIRERLEDEDYGNGPVARFSVDVLFVTGPRTGEVHNDVWVLGKGMTGALAREQIGAEVPYSLALGKRGTTPYAQANDVDDAQWKAVEAVYRERWWESAKTPVSVGADEQPPF